jgi:hypothetical protein
MNLGALLGVCRFTTDFSIRCRICPMQPSIRGTPPQHTKITSRTTRKKLRSPPKANPRHPQSTEPQQGTRASHSVARHAQHRGSTPKTVQNIRPAAAREKKATKIGSLAPPPVASLINIQPAQRLHHQATGPRGNDFGSPVWPSYFFFFSLRTIVLPDLPSLSLPPPFVLSGAPQTDEETTYNYCQIGTPRFESGKGFKGASVPPASCLQRQSTLWWLM